MLITILYFILILAIFLAVSWFSWWLTEGREEFKPKFLDYKPWICRTCLTFWLLVVSYIAAALALNSWLIGIAGTVLAILNAIAMKMDQKIKTISINEDNDDNK